MEPLVIYHGNCMDGFTAAWACWLKFPNAEFVPGVYGQAPPDVRGRDVYILDFSYSHNVLVDMSISAKSITILDHHRSAQRELAPLMFSDSMTIVFDMEKSGARLAWEWFHPDTPVPEFVLYVEDRDLGRFTLAFSKELNAAFFSFEYDFDKWNWLRQQCEVSAGSVALIAAGTAIERKHIKDVRELLRKTTRYLAFTKAWDQYPFHLPVANLPYTMSSDAAGLLAEGSSFGATYYVDTTGTYVFSLRSRNNGADVSRIAELYGGGGHKNAAGFRIKCLEDL